MRKIIFLIFGIYIVLVNFSFAQNNLNGLVYELTNTNEKKPIYGANIFWLNTSIGTSTDTNGQFSIRKLNNNNTLIISHTAYHSDTIKITPEQNFVEIKLKTKVYETENIDVSVNRPTTEIDFLAAKHIIKISNRELTKAACCNLSESFETNAAIDVSFTDAITGIKQIEMLGLSGIYTQTTIENLPFLRGLLSNIGLTYIPGSWINSINISKGIGSVANGYESITGQIDLDLVKPFAEEQKPLFINLFGDYDRRFESNINYRLKLNDDLSSINLFHFSSRKHKTDLNKDNFIDMPTFDFLNLMQRWQYYSESGLESQIGFQFIDDNKIGGTYNQLFNPVTSLYNSYNFESKSKLISIYTKNGYVFPDEHHKSFGVQLSYNNFSNKSFYGAREYSGKQQNFYFNFLYQSFFEEEIHNFRTGISFIYDEYDEKFQSLSFKRTEKVPGAFFEYTYSPDPTFSLIAGLRTDYHNHYGLMLTPRLHLRYSPDEDWVFRGAFGKGYKTANILTEYSSAFISNREMNIIANNDFGFGLNQEEAYIFGASLTHYFIFNYQMATFTIDYYRTNFINVVIPDLDSDPQKITFSSVKNASYSNSVQADLNIKPLSFWDFRFSYRFLDVKQLINNDWKERPFTSKHRILLNSGFTIFSNEVSGNKLLFDITLNWFDKKRIPSTEKNPVEYQTDKQSPAFFILNSQISYFFTKELEFYVGGENLLNFKQENPIISFDDPTSKYFDGSLIWGPVNGVMIYAGLRLNI